MHGNKYRVGLRPANAFKPGETAGAKNCKWVPAVELVCEHCFEPFYLKPWEAKGRRFCSRRCFELSGVFVGDNSPCWVGGPMTYRGRSWTDMRRLIIAKQAGRCADCGKVLWDSLPVHHIKPYREFDNEEEANQEENLVGLCQSCHMRRENELAGQS